MSPIARDLRGDMGCGAEALKADSLCVSSHLERAIANQPGAQERCCFYIAETGRDRKTIALMRDGIFRIAAIDLIAGEPRPVAKIFASAAAESTFAARPAQPGHAHAHAHLEGLHLFTEPLERADDFMSGNKRGLWIGELAIDHVQIGATDAASMDANDNFVRSGICDRARLVEPERLPSAVQHHGTHGNLLRGQA